MTFARQSLWSLGTLLFGVAASIVLARLLGAEARGEYALAVRLAALVLAVAQWGIPEVLLQEMADGRAQPATLAGTSLVLGLAGCLAAGLAVWLALPLLAAAGPLRGVDPWLVALALGGTVLSLVGLLGRRFLQLDGRLLAFNGLDLARGGVLLALAVLLGMALPRQADAALLAWLAGEALVAVGAGAYLLRRAAGGRRFDGPLARRLVLAGAPIQVGLVALVVGGEGGAYVVNATLDTSAVGVYAVALSVARLVLQVSMALRSALQPRLVAPGADPTAVTERVTRHALLWMVALSVALAFASPGLPLVFGDEFAAAGPALVLLLPGMVAYGAMQLVSGYLLRQGRRGPLAWSAWAFAALAIGLQWLGGALAGLPGVAAGLSAAYVAAAWMVLLTYSREAGRSSRHLVPGRSDLAWYLGLGRRAALP